MPKSPFNPPPMPDMAKGAVLPTSFTEKWLEEEKERERLKKQHRREFLMATYGIVGGLIAGIISGVASSLIVLSLQGLL